eukprot:COSAG01_NODE_3567_length_5925_cov_14.275318_7_plen_121_part_01
MHPLTGSVFHGHSSNGARAPACAARGLSVQPDCWLLAGRLDRQDEEASILHDHESEPKYFYMMGQPRLYEFYPKSFHISILDDEAKELTHLYMSTILSTLRPEGGGDHNLTYVSTGSHRSP